jgi:hypothetical protein
MNGAAEIVALLAADESTSSFGDKVVIALIGAGGVLIGTLITALNQRRMATRAEARDRKAERTAALSTARVLAPRLRDVLETLKAIVTQWPAMEGLAFEVDAQDAKVIARESAAASTALEEARGVMKSVRMRADAHRREGNRPPGDKTSRALLEQASTILANAIQALEALETSA